MAGRPRLSVEITQEQYDFLSNTLSHGEYKTLFGVIIDTVEKVTRQHGKMAIYAIISGEADFLRTLYKHSERIKDGSNQ